MAGQAQVPVTFEDVMVFLGRAEWDSLQAGQRELYRDVVLDTYELLTSLGYPGPKPDILHRLERGEEPWICPSPGHTRSWQEEPLSSWWPTPGGSPGLEEGPDPPSPGWRTLGCLQVQNLGCGEGRSEFPLEAAGGMGSQAQTWPVKEEVEDEQGVTENPPQSGTFPPHSTGEQQDTDPREQPWEDPGERSPGSSQSHGHTSGEALPLWEPWELGTEELRKAVLKDHSYCLRSRLGRPCFAPGPCSTGEHSYSQRRWTHGGFCCAWSRRARAARPLLGQRPHVNGILRRARDILRSYRPYWRAAAPRSCCSLCRARTDRTPAGSCIPKDRDGPGALRSDGNAGGGTMDTQATKVRPLEAPRTQWLQDLGAKGDVKGCAGCGTAEVASLQGVFQAVVQTVGQMLESVCRKLELQGFTQGKSIWPIIIQIDNVAEIEQL
ncbi:zinc finger protein 8-like [Myiozetetes cayanensis]|uniref:zinc finger protein 8-like n=1 Tax=Myiozetetes cayanensis TaxID=478635 RepID=UPI0021609579|nr:zinc finger protein 8-like [Myiozetetes cayanensis]